MGQLEPPDATPHGTREGPGLMTEEFAGDYPRGQGCTIDRDEKAIAARTQLVDRASDQFLSCAGFAENQDGAIRAGDVVNRLADGLHGRTFAGQRSEVAFRLRGVAQVGGLASEPLQIGDPRFEAGNLLVPLAATSAGWFGHEVILPHTPNAHGGAATEQAPGRYDSRMITVDPHSLLDLGAFKATFPRSLGELTTPSEVIAGFDPKTVAPLTPNDDVRAAVRALLRHGGFKPAGRSKPASEYLQQAAQAGSLQPINVAVDVCNAVSLHSGLPISVIDLDKSRPPLRVAIAPAGASYVFNASGQTIDLEGLLCLFDADGPSANAVKDAQRTKTGPHTRRTLTLIWGTTALPGRAARAEAWYRELLALCDATVDAI
jgi:hypothetical protein